MSNGRPRRGSIFGGLLLILIGVVFLLQYWIPDVVPLRQIARYWSVLLIAWGLAKLYDHFAAQRTGEAPPRSLTGGELLLLILILIFGGTVASTEWIHRHHPGMDLDVCWFEQPYTFGNELPAQTIQPNSQIAIHTTRGDIIVRAADTPTLHVVVTKKISASTQKEAEERARQVHVTIQEVSGGYQIQPEARGEPGGVNVNLEVSVPRQAGVTAKTGRGDILINDLAGAISAASGKGNIEIHNAGGNVDTELKGGDARITGVRGDLHLSGSGDEVEVGNVSGTASINGEFNGAVRVRDVARTTHFLSQRTDLAIGALPGHFEMDSDKLKLFDTPATVTLATKYKDIEMDNVTGRLRIADTHGDIEVRFPQPPREELNIADDSGSVTLVLPDKSSCEIAALSHSGEIECDFQAPTLKLLRDNENSRLEGKLGARGPQIHITTSYGTIHIRKATE